MSSKQILLRTFATKSIFNIYKTPELPMGASETCKIQLSGPVMKCPDTQTCSKGPSVSSLKVKWRKDSRMDDVMDNDRRWKLCIKVVREVLKEPGQVIPLRYLEKRRERLRLPVKVVTFLKKNPGLFDIYMDRIKPKTQPVKFLRVSDRLACFLEEEKKIKEENEFLLVDKLKRILMMSHDKRISAEKLLHVKRDFGFPDDFMSSLVPRYTNLFRVVGTPGDDPSYLELVSPDATVPLSSIERRAHEQSLKNGRPANPAFVVRLPPGMMLKKEMMEWTRNWMEQPYISPYLDASRLDPASAEMEKRTVAVIHEVLSLCVLKRMAVPILGKFCYDFRFPNAFPKIFTRHPGIFYLSLKGGVKTAILREAYDNAELIDKDPLVAIKEKFCQLLKEGYEERIKKEHMKRAAILQEMQIAAIRNRKTDIVIKNENVTGEYINARDDCSSAEEGSEEWAEEETDEKTAMLKEMQLAAIRKRDTNTIIMYDSDTDDNAMGESSSAEE